MEREEELARQELQGHLAVLEKEEVQVSKVHQDQQGPQDNQVAEVNQAHLEIKALKENLVHKVLLDNQVQQDS